MDQLDNPLTTRPIQNGCEVSIDPYLNWRLGWIEDSDRQFGYGSDGIRTVTRCAWPELLPTLQMVMNIVHSRCWVIWQWPSLLRVVKSLRANWLHDYRREPCFSIDENIATHRPQDSHSVSVAADAPPRPNSNVNSSAMVWRDIIWSSETLSVHRILTNSPNTHVIVLIFP